MCEETNLLIIGTDYFYYGGDLFITLSSNLVYHKTSKDGPLLPEVYSVIIIWLGIFFLALRWFHKHKDNLSNALFS